MSPLPLVIINPASAGGATADAWPRAASDLRRHFGPFNCAFTAGRGDAAAIAAREARAGRRFIVACGGDGTISEVANGILQSGAAAELGILPSGTGGDFRRTLGIPTQIAEAALVLRRGRTQSVDAGRVTYMNERGEEESRFFLNVASFGMGGEVIRRVKENDRLAVGGAAMLGGRASFALAALQTTLTFSKPSVRVRIDEGPESQMVVTNFCVANARYFGGGMKIAPEARLNDGLFDVVAIGDLATLSVIANSYRVYLGTHLGMRDVRHAPARRVEAKPAAGVDVSLEVDGELVGRLPATFEILPRALRVRCP
ncbi:MAG TPA: diacylglycerol kinase family protein [Pyrinomonadaceae bacterium]|jgi:YegS/Rv2252/BmrU family lipid kinase|nr:diacylglycerol kinase family protein [Pyrinomonadaceae bacterium]